MIANDRALRGAVIANYRALRRAVVANDHVGRLTMISHNDVGRSAMIANDHLLRSTVVTDRRRGNIRSHGGSRQPRKNGGENRRPTKGTHRTQSFLHET